MTTLRVSKDESQPEKKMPRRWRKVASFIFGMAGILLLGGCATALGLYLAGHETALTDWLQQARVPLFIWRLSALSRMKTILPITSGLLLIWLKLLRENVDWSHSVIPIRHAKFCSMMSLLWAERFALEPGTTSLKWG